MCATSSSTAAQRQRVAVKQRSVAGLGNGAVGADEGDVKAQGLRHGKRKAVPASGGQCNLHAQRVRPAQGGEVARAYLEVGIQQRSINIDCNQANGGHYTRFYNFCLSNLGC